MRRPWCILGGLVAAAMIGIWLPPFKVVPLKKVLPGPGVFEPTKFAEQFWTTRFLPALAAAPEANVVLAALAEDAPAAKTNFGRTVGMSDTAYYIMRGSGTVASVSPKAVAVALVAGSAGPDLQLGTGLLFGNTVRDASGLLDPGQFPNSQDFNDLSTALNQIVEKRVIPRLQQGAAAGRRLRFVVAAEIEAGAESDRPVRAVPLKVEFDQP
jgi:predicted lipoprotein